MEHSTSSSTLTTVTLFVYAALILTSIGYYRSYIASKTVTEPSSSSAHLKPSAIQNALKKEEDPSQKAEAPVSVSSTVLQKNCQKETEIFRNTIREKTKIAYQGLALTPSLMMMGYDTRNKTCLGAFSATIRSLSSSTPALPQMYFVVTVTSTGTEPILWSSDGKSFSLNENEYFLKVSELKLSTIQP